MNKNILIAVISMSMGAFSAFAQDKPADMKNMDPKPMEAAADASGPKHIEETLELLKLYENQLMQELHEDVNKKATDDQVLSVVRNIVKIQDAVTMLKSIQTIHIQSK